MNLVVMQNRTAVTSSLVVAESFEKEHKHVLRDIENIKISQSKLGLPNMFFESTYEKRGKQYKMHYMNRDGFTMLVGSFTGEKAMLFRYQYTQAFNEMEKQLLEMNRPSYEIMNPAERALRWAEEYEEKAALEEKLEEQKPKVLLAEAVMASEGSIEVGTLAKILNKNGIEIGRNKLFQILRENKYLKKEGKTKNEPMQDYVNKGWFEVILKPYFKEDGSTGTSSKTMVTAKGQKELMNLFLKLLKLNLGKLVCFQAWEKKFLISLLKMAFYQKNLLIKV